MIKAFSETITTGSESQYQEIELELGSKDWKKLLGQIRDWKKKGGTLHARLSGSKKKVALKISEPEIDPREGEATFDQITRQFESAYPGTGSEFDAALDKASNAGWNAYYIYDVLHDWFSGERQNIGPEGKEMIKFAFPELLEYEYNETPKNNIPRGNYYHPQVGWY